MVVSPKKADLKKFMLPFPSQFVTESVGGTDKIEKRKHWDRSVKTSPYCTKLECLSLSVTSNLV